MKHKISPIQILFLASMICFIGCRTVSKQSSEDMLLDELEQIGYFKYCDEEEYKKLKSVSLEEELINNLMFEYDDDTSLTFTKRNYHIDGEYLADEGGIHEFITSSLQPFIQASGFKLDLSEHIIKFDTITYNRYETLYVNGRKYEIFKNDFVRWGEAWYLAPLRIAEMINAELVIQNFEEQFYLRSIGNDLSGSFLSPSQYRFFKKHIKDPYWQPHTTTSWKKLYDIKT